MKTNLLISCGLLLSVLGSSQVSGPSSGLTFTTSPIAGSSVNWTGEEFLDASDDKWAETGNIPGAVGSYTDYLVVTNFALIVPAGTVIYGILVNVERSDPNLLTSDYRVRIVRGGLIGSSERSLGQSFPAADAINSYGGETDLWGETWTYKEVTNENFGIAIAVQRNGAGTTLPQIDDIQITVFYGFITLPVTLNNYRVTKENKSVLVSWQTGTEFQMDHYDVERSSDGRNFNIISTIPSLNLANSSYQFRDESPLAGKSYYRLNMKSISGAEKFTTIVPISFDKNNLINLSPSPWTKGMDLYINNPVKEPLTIQFYSNAGHILGKTTTTSTQIEMPSLSGRKGIVFFRVVDKFSQPKGSGSLYVY